MYCLLRPLSPFVLLAAPDSVNGASDSTAPRPSRCRLVYAPSYDSITSELSATSICLVAGVASVTNWPVLLASASVLRAYLSLLLTAICGGDMTDCAHAPLSTFAFSCGLCFLRFCVLVIAVVTSSYLATPCMFFLVSQTATRAISSEEDLKRWKSNFCGWLTIETVAAVQHRQAHREQ